MQNKPTALLLIIIRASLAKSLKTLLSVFIIKNVFGNILKNTFETLKKTPRMFFEKHLGDVFKKKTLKVFRYT